MVQKETCRPTRAIHTHLAFQSGILPFVKTTGMSRACSPKLGDGTKEKVGRLVDTRRADLYDYPCDDVDFSTREMVRQAYLGELGDRDHTLEAGTALHVLHDCRDVLSKQNYRSEGRDCATMLQREDHEDHRQSNKRVRVIGDPGIVI